MPWRPAAIAEATTPEPQESVSPSTPRSQVRTSMRLARPARTKLTLAPSGIAGWWRRGGPKRSIASLREVAAHEDDQVRHADLHRDRRRRQAAPGDRDRDPAGAGTAGSARVTLLAVHARLDRSPAGLEHRGSTPVDEAVADGVARGAARPVGAEGRGPAVGVEVVDPDAPGLAGREKERAVGPDREPAPADQRQAAAVLVGQARPSASKTRKSLPPPAILTKRRGQGHGSGSLIETAEGFWIRVAQAAPGSTTPSTSERLGDRLRRRRRSGCPPGRPRRTV